MTWSTSYYHYDALGSARQLTNAAEATTDSYDYDAWGSAVSSSGTTQNTFRWNGRSGYYWDSDSSTNYVRARHYAPSLGRWLSVDPSSANESPSGYIYVFCNPTNDVDPSGLLTWTHRVHRGPINLDDKAVGYLIWVRQSLGLDELPDRLPANPGTQTWQINRVVTNALETKDGACSFIKPQRNTKLDVINLTNKRTPINITDKVGFRDAGNAKICFLMQVADKLLGLRPYDQNFNPIGPGVPPGVGYEATPAQIRIALTKMKPFLYENGKPVKVVYIYINKNHCCDCSNEQLEQVNSIIKGIDRAVDLDDVKEGVEFVRYGELGQWFELF